jgi:hypothetical protein
VQAPPPGERARTASGQDLCADAVHLGRWRSGREGRKVRVEPRPESANVRPIKTDARLVLVIEQLGVEEPTVDRLPPRRRARIPQGLTQVGASDAGGSVSIS